MLRHRAGPVLRNLAARAEHGEPPSSLPSRPGGFTGRAAELDAIEAAAGGRRTVWVSGPPGVGKTGLAIEAGHRLRDRFPDGQLLARLNGFTPGVPAVTVADALNQLLVELGVPPEQIPATEARKVTLYQTTLYGTRTLVVLDNAASPDQVRSLLPEAPGCFAIVTSRRIWRPGHRGARPAFAAARGGRRRDVPRVDRPAPGEWPAGRGGQGGRAVRFPADADPGGGRVVPAARPVAA